MAYDEAHKKATLKYREKSGIVKLTVDVTKETRERYKAQAEKKGLSLAAYITKLIEQDIQNT